jgi:hypothetical protein
VSAALAAAGAVCVTVALLAVGCSSEPAVHVPLPDGPGGGCAALHHGLPSEVDGRSARDVTPASDRTAAWGSPAVVLRCGVRSPAGLAATSELVEVDGVDWFLDERASAYVFTMVGRVRFVEVRVPSSVPRTTATSSLVDLAPALRRAYPTR